MKSSRITLLAALCGLVFSLALPVSNVRAAPLPAGPVSAIPGLEAPGSPLAAFDPITHTVLPGGNYSYDAFTIRSGIVVTFTGAVSVSVAGDLDIAGRLIGDCFPLALHVQGNITITGTVDNRCTTPSNDPGDLTIYTYGGDMLIGTVDTPAELYSAGSTNLSNDPTLQEWEFDVLPNERSTTPLPPVCAAEADTLVGAALVSPTAGAEVAFYGEGADPDGGPVTYSWDMGDGGSSTEQSPVYTYTTWGTYDVVLTVEDDEGTTCEATLRIVVDDGEVNFPEEPAVNAGPAELVVPAGQESYLYAAALDPQWEEVIYQWDMGDGGTSTETNPIHTYADPGRYEVTLLVTDTAGYTSTADASIYVYPSFMTFLPVVFQAATTGLLSNATPTQLSCIVPGPGFFNVVDVKPQGAPGRRGGDISYIGRGNIVLGGGTNMQAGDGGDGVSRVGAGTVRGGSGGKGGSFKIRVAGRLTICGGATLSGGDGGDGGDATSNTPPPGTARAIGGRGGRAGSLFSLRATRGVSFESPFGFPVVVNPGSGGEGGTAIANGGDGADGGCQGDPGATAYARGGNGGKASKSGRGRAGGLGNLQVDGGMGGAGGAADAYGGDGGDADCAGTAIGGNGQQAYARGGLGGRAAYSGAFRNSLSATAFTAGAGGAAWAEGGDGGWATATANPPACGAATATGGDGDYAKAYGGKGGAGRIDGNGGDADAWGGWGGDANATGGDCTNCGDGGPGTATGGDGDDARAMVGRRGGRTASDGMADAMGGWGGDADATGGQGGDCANCPAGAGGDGGAAVTTGGQGGDATGNGDRTGGDGGTANALGGEGGKGATCCDPPQGGGKGGRGGDATSTAGNPGNPGGAVGGNGIRGGNGGHGGDGEPAGAGGDPGLGQGTPVDIPDGNAGQPGGGCPPCAPPSDTGMGWVPDNPFAGTVITFTGSATGTMPMTFTWDFGDYAQGEGNPIQHVYEMPGEYLVTLTVTNACGSAVATATVAVDPSTCVPPYDTTFVWTPFYPVAGQPITFTGQASGTLPIDYIWDFGDGGTAVGDVVVHIFEIPMDYLVTLTATNDCGKDALTQVVVVEPPLAPRGLGRTLLFVSPSRYRAPYLPLLRR